MIPIYDVRIQANHQPDNYRITWQNMQQQTADYFDQTQHLLTEAENNHLWQLPEHQQDIGRKLFRFLDGDARHLSRALAEAAGLGNATPLV